MKKLITTVFAISTSLALFAAGGTSSYTDGRVAVATDGDLPRGLFAKAAGYLPGDSISVTNPESGQSEEILVLGSLDSKGEAVLVLSKEAAENLGVLPNSTLQVKIAKRLGSYDKSVTGSAILSHSLEEANLPITEDTENKEEKISALESVPDEFISEETALLPLDSEKDNNVSEEPFVNEENRIAEEEISTTNDAILSATEETLANDNELIAASPRANEPSANLSALDYYEPGKALTRPNSEIKEEAVSSIEPVTTEEVAENPLTEESNIPEEDMYGEEVAILEPEIIATPEEVFESPSEEVVAKEPIIVEPEPIKVDEIETVPQPNEYIVEDDSNKAEEEMPIVLVPTEAIASETNEPSSEEESAPAIILVPITDSSSEAAKYQPVVLVPADPKAPPYSDKPKTQPKEPVTTPSPVEPAPAPKQNPVVNVPVVTVPANDLLSKRTVSENALRKGKYYVQIATSSDKDSITSMLKKYASYPLVTVPLSDGRTYKVMVGPMSVDEYGVILERFKAFGYKDAFVKFIK